MTAVVRRTVGASAEHVFDVLSDGFSYAAWVVGASRVRDVDGHWPATGSRIHHSVGAWPFVVDDKTTVVSSVPNASVDLDVAVWFLGRGRVVVRIEPAGDTRCTVIMSEWMTEGLLSKVPGAVIDPLLRFRNVESLQRLAAIAEGREGTPDSERKDA